MERMALLRDYRNLGHIAEATRELLAALVEDQSVTRQQRSQLDATLSHLTDVREGFVVSLRTGSVAERSELADLVHHILFDWEWLEAFGLELMPDAMIHIPRKQLLSFAHSYLALALIPRLPAQRVTFPSPRSYADIPVPRRAGDLLARIEELEEVIARVQQEPTPLRLSSGSLRRTYGFFESSAWLVRDHMELFDAERDE